LAEHRRLIDAVDGNERRSREPQPDSFRALGVRARVAATLRPRGRLSAAPAYRRRRMHVAAEAARLLAKHRRLIADFKEHVPRWGPFASADEDRSICIRRAG